MPSVLIFVSLANCFSQPHSQIHSYAPAPMFVPAPEMHYAQRIPQQFAQPALQQFEQPTQPMAPQQFARPDQPMAPQFAQPGQPIAPAARPMASAFQLEPPPFRYDTRGADVRPPQQMPQLVGVQQVEQYVVLAEAAPPQQDVVPLTQQFQQQLQQQQQPETKSEEGPLNDLPVVELMPKPRAKLDFTNDAANFKAQRDAYDQGADEYMQHLNLEFENMRLLAVQQKDDLKNDIDARIDLQVSNHEELLELEFERQQGLLAQHVETRNDQLLRKVSKERAAQQEQAEERLGDLLEMFERTRTEQLEAIKAAAAKESEKFDQAKAFVEDYHRGAVSDEVDITSDVQAHADNYENILRLKMEELQEAPSE